MLTYYFYQDSQKVKSHKNDTHCRYCGHLLSHYNFSGHCFNDGCSSRAVDDIIAYIRTGSGRNENIRQVLTRAFLENEYIANKKTIYRISKEQHITCHTIKKYLQEYGMVKQ